MARAADLHLASATRSLSRTALLLLVALAAVASLVSGAAAVSADEAPASSESSSASEESQRPVRASTLRFVASEEAPTTSLKQGPEPTAAHSVEPEDRPPPRFVADRSAPSRRGPPKA
jgi:hypothetical protein